MRLSALQQSSNLEMTTPDDKVARASPAPSKTSSPPVTPKPKFPRPSRASSSEILDKDRPEQVVSQFFPSGGLLRGTLGLWDFVHAHFFGGPFWVS